MISKFIIYFSFNFFLCPILISGQNIDDELDSYRPLESYVELKGGEFMMGINDREGVNYEYPQKRAIVEPFRISLYPTTIASFKKFKNEKYKFRTDAELIGSSWVFNPLVNVIGKLDTKTNTNDPESQQALNMNMTRIQEARWNRPEGGNSTIRHILNYPAVHVSYNDAVAYCTWKRMRLPNEIEWEYAARGGLKEKPYPWGDIWEIGRTNLWQGKFPDHNQLRDGHYGLSPVDAFSAQNSYEMYDMIGNTWEWTTTKFRNPNKIEIDDDRRVLKGGSFIDTRDAEDHKIKLKIRISSRIGRNRNYTAQNVGFRCAQSIRKEENIKFDDSNFNVVKIRAPIHHGQHIVRKRGEL